jgi:hypothetical protein
VQIFFVGIQCCQDFFQGNPAREGRQIQLLVKKRNSALANVRYTCPSPFMFHLKQTKFENHISVKICENISFLMPSAGKSICKKLLKKPPVGFFILFLRPRISRSLTFFLGPLSYVAELSATLLASWTEFQFFFSSINYLQPSTE